MVTLYYKAEILESELTDGDAAKIVKELKGEFPRSLYNTYCLSSQPMSNNQRFWLHKLALTEIEARKNKEVVGDIFTVFHTMLNKAGEKLQAPKIRLLSVEGGGEEIKLYLASLRTTLEGYVIIYGDVGFLGKIDKSGVFYPNVVKGATTPNWLIPTLKAFAENPQQQSKRYGALTGRCCFCYLSLSNTKSVNLGFGPVCGKRYGLI